MDCRGGGALCPAARGCPDAGGLPQLYPGLRTCREGDHARRVLSADHHQRTRFEGEDFGREPAARHDCCAEEAGRRRGEAAQGGEPVERVLQEEDLGSDGQIPVAVGNVGRGGAGLAGAGQPGDLGRLDPEGFALEDRRIQGAGASGGDPQRPGECRDAGRGDRSDGGQVLLHLRFEQRRASRLLQQRADAGARAEGRERRCGRVGRGAARIQEHQARVQRPGEVRPRMINWAKSRKKEERRSKFYEKNKNF